MARLDDTDLKAIRQIMREEIKDEVAESKQELLDKMQSNHSEAMNSISSFAKEIQDNRDERTVLAHQVSNHEDRIEKLETKLHN